jgi:hypothetical protein
LSDAAQDVAQGDAAQKRVVVLAQREEGVTEA